MPPPTAGIDVAWDEDESGVHDIATPPAGDPYSRPTKRPPVPSEEMAADLMRAARSDPPDLDRRKAPTTPMRLTGGVAAGPASVRPALDSMPEPDDLAAPLPRPHAPPRDLLSSRPRISDLPVDHGIPAEMRPPSFGPAARPPPPLRPTDAEDRIAAVRERYALGDFSGALEIADAILRDDAGDEEARRFANTCREVLEQMYGSRLGGGAAIPAVVMTREQIHWMSLDHRQGFLLSLVDGRSTIDDILDISGMPRLDALRLLSQMADQGVIACR